MILATGLSNGQTTTSIWNKDLGQSILWQQVTPMGHYLVGTSSTLMGVNPETGQIIWSTEEFGSLSADQVNQVGSSPLIAVNKGEEVYMIDPFTGDTKFNSRKAGVREIRDQIVLYTANGILISGRDADNKDILLMSSLANGEVAWKIDDEFGRLVTAEELNANELLIVTIYYNYKLNPSTGEIIWKNDVSEANKQLESLGAFGGLLKQAASNMAQDVEFNVEFYQHPSQPIFYIASEQEDNSSMSTTSSIAKFKTSYTAYSLKDGSRVWKNPLEVSGHIGPVYFHEKGLVILPNDDMNTKINLYDYNSQEGMWGKKGRGLKIKGGVYSYAKAGDGLVVVSQNANGKNFLSYLDMSQGILTFDKPVKVDGTVVYSENTPKGLLYITSEEINIMNKTDGTLLLSDPIHASSRMTAHKDNFLYAFDYKDGVIKKLDKTTGTVTVLSQEIKFDGKESPESIELRDNGILVSASQNMALISYDGNTVYQKYFEAPREAGIIRALRYAQAVRAAYIGAAAYTASAAFQSAGEQVKEDDPVAGAVASGVGQAYGQLGDAATDFAKKSWQQASARFKATSEANDYMVILAKEDKNNFLMKVDKNSGEVQGKIDLGKEREPNYVMDGVTGMVFYNTGGGAVTAYQY